MGSRDTRTGSTQSQTVSDNSSNRVHRNCRQSYDFLYQPLPLEYLIRLAQLAQHQAFAKLRIRRISIENPGISRNLLKPKLLFAGPQETKNAPLKSGASVHPRGRANDYQAKLVLRL